MRCLLPPRDGWLNKRERRVGNIVSMDIYEEGRRAKANGTPDQGNPYEAGSQESLDWLEGYTAGEPEPSSTGPDNDP